MLDPDEEPTESYPLTERMTFNFYLFLERFCFTTGCYELTRDPKAEHKRRMLVRKEFYCSRGYDEGLMAGDRDPVAAG